MVVILKIAIIERRTLIWNAKNGLMNAKKKMMGELTLITGGSA